MNKKSVGIKNTCEPKRVLTCGDIHGALKALIQCLERANFNLQEDELIFLGDYVDGWSESAELIEYLIELERSMTYDCIFMLGNHDKWCKDWLNNGQAPLIWTQQGGQSTIDSYIRTGYLAKQSHRDFFNACNLYYIDEQNRGFVHGGYNSRKGLGHEIYESDYYWDRDLWNLALMQHKRFHDAEPAVLEQVRRFEKHKEIFIGHTSTNNWNVNPHYDEYHDPNQAKQGIITVPMNRCNVWNLDTGCGSKNGKLTIMDIETKFYWQSDVIKTLYPEEIGRGY